MGDAGNPQLPDRKPLEETGSRKDDELRAIKERRTRIKRLWGQGASEGAERGVNDNEEFWVDIEVLDNATDDGRQWLSDYNTRSMRGNQAQDTITKIKNDRGDLGGRTREDISIAMNPEDPEKGPYVTIFATEKIRIESRRGQIIERSFFNSRTNNMRVSAKRRIQCNNIDEEFMHEDPDATNEDQKQPPTDPKKYKQAVKDTDDPQSLYLQVFIPISYKSTIGKSTQYQTMKYTRDWGDEPFIKLPDESATDPKRKDAEWIMMDPYQTVINFGPDSLAVEFHAGDGPADPDDDQTASSSSDGGSTPTTPPGATP